MLFTTDTELKYLVDIDVLLDRRLDQADAQLAAELLHLEAVDLGPVEEVQLGHDQHHGDVAALLLHLLLPLGDGLERLPVNTGEGEDTGLGAPVVSSGDAVELLLTGGVPQHQSDVLPVQADNKRELGFGNVKIFQVQSPIVACSM